VIRDNAGVAIVGAEWEYVSIRSDGDSDLNRNFDELEKLKILCTSPDYQGMQLETVSFLRIAKAIYQWAGGADTMTKTTAPAWEAKRTDETRTVEDLLRKAGFQQVDAYRYNSASIRVRVIDRQFESIPREKRDEMVEPHLEKLPERTQADIVTLFTFAPSDLKQTPKTLREVMLNTEFDNPSPSML
jgi:hypothetical protein